jgi:hypothetical protein
MINFAQMCEFACFPQDTKLARGYGNVYDIIFNTLGHSIHIVELGVGGGTSHARWTYGTTGNVIGLEIAGPDQEKCSSSLFTGDSNIVDRQIDIARMSVELFSQLPTENKDRLDIRYYTDALDPINANKIVETYGKLPLVINDSKHAPHLHRLFRDTWFDTITDTGILVQEDIARWVNDTGDIEFEEPKAKELVRALEAGWRVFQFQDYDTMDKKEFHYRANVIGVLYKNNVWDQMFEQLKTREITLDNYLNYCTGN